MQWNKDRRAQQAVGKERKDAKEQPLDANTGSSLDLAGRLQQVQTQSSGTLKVLPVGKLIRLLDALVQAYGSPSVQLKLKEFKQKHRIDQQSKGKLHGTSLAYQQDLLNTLSPLQAPIFERFNLPKPPEGVFTLWQSCKVHTDSEEVFRLGNYCRILLGQLDTVVGMEMPLTSLIPLLYHLRNVYSLPLVQEKLQDLRLKFRLDEAEKKGRRSFHVTSQAYAQEQRDLLFEFQKPVFEMLRLPGPPLGIDILVASVFKYRANDMVVQLGSQCRLLLGQIPELMKDGQPSLPAVLDILQQIPCDVRFTRKIGYGLFALRSIAVGERILLEEPLAVLRCGADILSSPTAIVELWRSGKVKNILSSQLGSGPKKSPKGTMYKYFAREALQKHNVPEQEILDVGRALCVFGFNAFALPGDKAQALYPGICMANHSCMPNAAIVTLESGPSELVCVEEIQADDEITVSYLSARDLFLDYPERQEQLFVNWEFHCCCHRCTKEQETTADAVGADVVSETSADAASAAAGEFQPGF